MALNKNLKAEPKVKAESAPVASQSDMVLIKLASIEREVARIQKKLGIDFSWYKS